MKKEKIYENITYNISIENFKKIDKRNYMIKNILNKTLMIVMCILSITGMVFAKNISVKVYDNLYGTGSGVGKAIEEGYIENPDMVDNVSIASIENEETGDMIEDFETKIKVNEFVMDDFSLSMTFEVTLSDKIKDIINPEKIWDMYFSNIIVYDENNIVLFSAMGRDFNEFCNEKNLGYTYETVPEGKLFGSGNNGNIIEKNGNTIKLTFNIYTGGDCLYPKSKKINIDIGRIRIQDKAEGMRGTEEIVIKGNWNITIDVPEKMYNRSSSSYIQKSSNNEDFKVTEAILYDTGMDISMEFKAEKIPDPLTSPKMEFWKTLPEDDELKTIDILNYLEHEIQRQPGYQESIEKRLKVWDFDKYLTNENGDEFGITIGSRENGSGYIDDNGIYYFNGLFDLTKYDMTDTVILHIDYHGNTADILLEKVEE